MTVSLAITDHALLRWMERRYGIDVSAWRQLCREDAEAALDRFSGAATSHGPAFVVDPGDTVITYVAAGQCIMRPTDTAIAIAAALPTT